MHVNYAVTIKHKKVHPNQRSEHEMEVTLSVILTVDEQQTCSMSSTTDDLLQGHLSDYFQRSVSTFHEKLGVSTHFYGL